MNLVFEKSVPGRRAVRMGPSDVSKAANIDSSLLREKDAELPQLSELDVVRHFTELSSKFRRRYQFLPAGLMHDEVQP